MLNAAAPGLVLCFSGVGFAGGGFVFPLVFGLFGLVLAAVLVLDYPVTTVFGAEGIERRCLLRTERLEWDRLQSVARVKKSRGRSFDRVAGLGGLAGRTRSPGPEGEPQRVSSGLVAEAGKRPHLLTDRIESRPEFEALEAGMKIWAPGLALRASRPADEVPATFSYKRRAGGVKDPLVDRLVG